MISEDVTAVRTERDKNDRKYRELERYELSESEYESGLKHIARLRESYYASLNSKELPTDVPAASPDAEALAIWRALNESKYDKIYAFFDNEGVISASAPVSHNAWYKKPEIAMECLKMLGLSAFLDMRVAYSNATAVPSPSFVLFLAILKSLSKNLHKTNRFALIRDCHVEMASIRGFYSKTPVEMILGLTKQNFLNQLLFLSGRDFLSLSKYSVNENRVISQEIANATIPQNDVLQHWRETSKEYDLNNYISSSGDGRRSMSKAIGIAARLVASNARKDSTVLFIDNLFGEIDRINEHLNTALAPVNVTPIFISTEKSPILAISHISQRECGQDKTGANLFTILTKLVGHLNVASIEPKDIDVILTFLHTLLEIKSLTISLGSYDASSGGIRSFDKHHRPIGREGGYTSIMRDFHALRIKELVPLLQTFLLSKSCTDSFGKIGISFNRKKFSNINRLSIMNLFTVSKEDKPDNMWEPRDILQSAIDDVLEYCKCSNEAIHNYAEWTTLDARKHDILGLHHNLKVKNLARDVSPMVKYVSPASAFPPNREVKSRFSFPQKDWDPNLKIDKKSNIDLLYSTPALKVQPNEPCAKSNVVVPRPQDDVVVPRPQDNVVVPRLQDDVVVPRPQDDVVVPRPQDDVVVPRLQDDVVEPCLQDDVAVPRLQDDVVVPRLQDDVVVPRLQDDVIESYLRSLPNEIEGDVSIGNDEDSSKHDTGSGPSDYTEKEIYATPIAKNVCNVPAVQKLPLFRDNSRAFTAKELSAWRRSKKKSPNSVDIGTSSSTHNIDTPLYRVKTSAALSVKNRNSTPDNGHARVRIVSPPSSNMLGGEMSSPDTANVNITQFGRKTSPLTSNNNVTRIGGETPYVGGGDGAINVFGQEITSRACAIANTRFGRENTSPDIGAGNGRAGRKSVPLPAMGRKIASANRGNNARF